MNNFILNALLTINLNSVFRNPNISFETTERLRNFERENQSIIPTPPHQRMTIVTKLSDLQEQPCNQQTFFRRLHSDSHWNECLHTPNFLLRPFFQTPEQRCFVTSRFYIDLAVQNNLVHRSQSNIPNSVLQFYHPILTKTEYKIAGWEKHPPRSISNINNADAITFMFHVISSFFERHERLKFQIFSAPLPHPKFIQNQYCHVRLNMLPRIDNVQYDTTVTHLIDQDNIHECDLDQMVFISRLPQNIMLIGFSGENFMPIVPLNAKNDRVYFQRYLSETSEPLTNASSPWLILKIQLGLKLRAEPTDVFVLPWKHSHILDHKHLFTPQVLRPHYLTTVFAYPKGIQFHHNHTGSPHTVSFPMTIQQQSPNNINWTNYLHNRCDAAALNNIIFPYGSLEILLLKTSPPTNNSEICQVLPDVTNPRKSYAELETKITDFTTRSVLPFWTWNYPTLQNHTNFLTDHQYQQNLNILYTKYNKFSNKNFKTLQKLQRFRMAKHFDQFRINLLKHTLHNSDETIVNSNISYSINKTLQQKKAHAQVTKTLATKLWQIHLIRQTILHKTYIKLHLKKFTTTVRHDKHFKPNEIYEHQLKGNSVYSRSRLKIVNRPFADRNSIHPNTQTLHPFLRKIINLFNHAIHTSVKLISETRKYFTTSQYATNNPLLTQISLNKLNAHI